MLWICRSNDIAYRSVSEPLSYKYYTYIFFNNPKLFLCYLDP